MGMKGYKGFRKGLICKDKQYAENTIFEESEANIGVNGMHFCKNPMDVLDYYPLIDNNGEMCEFSEVEALDETITNDDKKYCTKKLKIGARLSLAEFIRASFDVTYRQIKEEVESVSDKEKSGDGSKIAGGYGSTLAGGDGSTLAGGDGSKIAGGDGSTLAGGNWAKIAGEDWSKIAGGHWAKIAGGDGSKIAGGDGSTLAGGNWAKIAGGDWSKIAGGNWAKIAGGNWAKIAGGKHTIMISENDSKAKGGIGSLIVMVERNNKGEIVNYKAIQIDGDTYKEDTWYQLEDGEIKEAEE